MRHATAWCGAARRLLVAVGLVAAIAAPPPAAAQAGAQWTTAGGTVQGTRYSKLDDITPANVATLTEEFAYPTGTVGSHEGGPLVVGSTMYVVTPLPNYLIALDLAHPGTALWTFDPHANGYARGVACCDVVNRGPAYADGKIIYATLDGTVVAVDATAGTQVWRTKLADPTKGETITGAPIVVDRKVIVGNAGGELGVRGWVQALDLGTGAPVWKAYATGPDSDVLIGAGFHPFYAKDQGTDLGTSTWPGSMWQQGGATSWAWLTYDPDLKLLYYGTSNPGVWNPDMRPGDNKWSSTIFARDPRTGQAVWAYQLTPHDGWDYDAVNESIVADLPIAGVTRHVIMHVNKNGFAYTIDRATGQILVVGALGNATWATGVDTATGLAAQVAALQPHQGIVTAGICPSPLGAKDWEPMAFSPKTGLLYVPAINACDSLEPLLALYIAGTPFMGAAVSFAPGPGGNFGELVAWNPATGTRAWSIPEPLPVYSGVLATAGGLVFYGTLSGALKAVDARTGALLWQTQLECGITGSPIAYDGPDGKQRIAVYSGIGWLAGGFAGGACPKGGGDGVPPANAPLAGAIARLPARPGAAATAGTGYVHVFKLP